jgi:hypothetical protein
MISRQERYVSRFWIWRFWPNDGFFGLEALRRGGDQVRQQLRAVAKSASVGEINAVDIVVWGALIVLVLSLAHSSGPRLLG